VAWGGFEPPSVDNLRVPAPQVFSISMETGASRTECVSLSTTLPARRFPLTPRSRPGLTPTLHRHLRTVKSFLKSFTSGRLYIGPSQTTAAHTERAWLVAHHGQPPTPAAGRVCPLTSSASTLPVDRLTRSLIGWITQSPLGTDAVHGLHDFERFVKWHDGAFGVAAAQAAHVFKDLELVSAMYDSYGVPNAALTAQRCFLRTYSENCRVDCEVPVL